MLSIKQKKRAKQTFLFLNASMGRTLLTDQIVEDYESKRRLAFLRAKIHSDLLYTGQ